MLLQCEIVEGNPRRLLNIYIDLKKDFHSKEENEPEDVASPITYDSLGETYETDTTDKWIPEASTKEEPKPKRRETDKAVRTGDCLFHGRRSEQSHCPSVCPVPGLPHQLSGGVLGCTSFALVAEKSSHSASVEEA